MISANSRVFRRARAIVLATWVKQAFGRLLAPGSRRIGTLQPERWSRHMLRDVGLADAASTYRAPDA